MWGGGTARSGTPSASGRWLASDTSYRSTTTRRTTIARSTRSTRATKSRSNRSGSRPHANARRSKYPEQRAGTEPAPPRVDAADDLVHSPHGQRGRTDQLEGAGEAAEPTEYPT